ncbi:MAG: YicC family protein [Gammaproteobacteria bacterium]|nr:YicC family protein [Gammaproteobacteria bacterium]
MLKSMTGFSRYENQNEDLTCKVEIRSVNNRFIDINTRLPKSLAPLELPLKKMVKSKCARGSFDISIAIEKNGDSKANLEVAPNLPLATEYLNAFKNIQEGLGLKGEIDINTILSQRDVVKPELKKVEDSSEEIVLQTVDKTLTDLVKMREDEGKNLEKDILNQISSIKALGKLISTKQSITVQEFQDKLKEKIQTLTTGIEIDPARIAQESALLADRCDVTEELVRLESHLDQFNKLVASHEPQGRKLEFLTQEINREVNTMGSKTIDLEVSKAVIEMKSCLEKIREQLANIE